MSQEGRELRVAISSIIQFVCPLLWVHYNTADLMIKKITFDEKSDVYTEIGQIIRRMVRQAQENCTL